MVAAAANCGTSASELFITGYAENSAIGNCMLEPGMAVMTKPFVMATLGNRIRDLIAR
jgi:hypothetical protein